VSKSIGNTLDDTTELRFVEAVGRVRGVSMQDCIVLRE
jgi:hypothetical protein